MNKESNILATFGKTAEQYIIYPSLAGTLVKGGKPLTNSKIISRLTWSGNETGISEHFITDNKGHLTIPVYEQQLPIAKLTEFIGTITLYID